MEILNIDLEEKTDTTIRITYRDDTTNLPVDVTDYEAILEIRPQFGSSVLLDTLSTADDTIVLGGEEGTIDLIFNPTDSDQSATPVGWTRGAYDLVLIDGDGKRKKLLKGFITVARSSTLNAP